MRKEQLPKLEARPPTPPTTARRIRVANTAHHVADLRRQVLLGDEDLCAVRRIAQLRGRQVRDGVVGVGDAAIPRHVVVVVGGRAPDPEAAVDVGGQRGVADARLAEGRHGGRVARRQQLQARQRGHRPAQRVAHQHERVVAVRGQRREDVRQDHGPRVPPRRVEAHVHRAVGALWGVGRVAAWVWHVLLRHRSQVRDRVRDAICPAEGHDDSWSRR